MMPVDRTVWRGDGRWRLRHRRRRRRGSGCWPPPASCSTSEGVHTVGIDRVIERAGVAKASLYNTFGSKDELVRAYLEGRHAQHVGADHPLPRAVQRRPRERLLGVFEAQGELFAAARVPRLRVRQRERRVAGRAGRAGRRRLPGWVRDAADRPGQGGRRAGAGGARPAAAHDLRRRRRCRPGWTTTRRGLGRRPGGRRDPARRRARRGWLIFPVCLPAVGVLSSRAFRFRL